MHKEPLARGKLRFEELRAARERCQRLSLNALDKSICERKAQVRAVQLDVVKDETLHYGGQPPPDGFDLREFWHAPML